MKTFLNRVRQKSTGFYGYTVNIKLWNKEMIDEHRANLDGGKVPVSFDYQEIHEFSFVSVDDLVNV